MKSKTNPLPTKTEKVNVNMKLPRQLDEAVTKEASRLGITKTAAYAWGAEAFLIQARSHQAETKG